MADADAATAMAASVEASKVELVDSSLFGEYEVSGVKVAMVAASSDTLSSSSLDTPDAFAAPAGGAFGAFEPPANSNGTSASAGDAFASPPPTDAFAAPTGGAFGAFEPPASDGANAPADDAFAAPPAGGFDAFAAPASGAAAAAAAPAADAFAAPPAGAFGAFESPASASADAVAAPPAGGSDASGGRISPVPNKPAPKLPVEARVEAELETDEGGGQGDPGAAEATESTERTGAVATTHTETQPPIALGTTAGALCSPCDRRTSALPPAPAFAYPLQAGAVGAGYSATSPAIMVVGLANDMAAPGARYPIPASSAMLAPVPGKKLIALYSVKAAKLQVRIEGSAIRWHSTPLLEFGDDRVLYSIPPNIHLFFKFAPAED